IAKGSLGNDISGVVWTTVCRAWPPRLGPGFPLAPGLSLAVASAEGPLVSRVLKGRFELLTARSDPTDRAYRLMTYQNHVGIATNIARFQEPARSQGRIRVRSYRLLRHVLIGNQAIERDGKGA